MKIDFELGSESVAWWIANIEKGHDVNSWYGNVPIMLNGTLIPDFLCVEIDMGDCGDIDITAYLNIKMKEFADNAYPNETTEVELIKREYTMFEAIFKGFLIGKGLCMDNTPYEWDEEYCIKNRKTE